MIRSARHVVFSLIALSFSSVMACAQTSSPLVLDVNDAAPLSGFPQGVNADVLGVKIGMTFDEARSAMEAAELPMLVNAQDLKNEDPYAPRRMGYEFGQMSLAPVFGWKDGFQVELAPVLASAGMTMMHEVVSSTVSISNETTETSNTYFGDEYLYAAFGNPSAGSRVRLILRKQKFPEPLDTAALAKRVTEKYGEPSMIEDGRWLQMSWYYKDGAQVMRSDKSGFLVSRKCKPSGSYDVASGMLYGTGKVGDWLSSRGDTRTSKDDCDALIMARIYKAKVDGTADQLEIFVIDNLAAWVNEDTINQQADAAHQKWLSENTGSKNVPDL